MQTWIITGGAGFIGSNFVRLARARTSARLVVFDKLTYAGHLESLEGVDRRRPRALRARRHRLARRRRGGCSPRPRPPRWSTSPPRATSIARSTARGEFVRTNINGTFELLEAARALLHGATDDARRAFRFLHVSTDEVYGSLGPTGFFTETTPYAPNSPYSASKAAADHLVRAYHETFGVPVLLTNCSNNYGPYQFPEKLVPLMILNALDGKPLPIYGQGQNIRDWLHVEDHCTAILRVLEAGVPGEKYNVGGNSERTNLEVVARALRRAGGGGARRRRTRRWSPPGEASYLDLKTFVPDRPGHDLRYAIDASKDRARARRQRRPTRSPRAWPPRCGGTSTTRAGARR